MFNANSTKSNTDNVKSMEDNTTSIPVVSTNLETARKNVSQVTKPTDAQRKREFGWHENETAVKRTNPNCHEKKANTMAAIMSLSDPPSILRLF